MYIKTLSKNGEPLELTLDELKVFSTCHCCGAEVPQPDFWENVKNDPDFDPYTTEAYCNRCSSLSVAERHILTKCRSVKSEAEPRNPPYKKKGRASVGSRHTPWANKTSRAFRTLNFQ